jgi:nitrite reductase/ring-hydroxylating ferredoxin subunit
MGLWHSLCRADEVTPGHGAQFSVGDKVLAVFNLDGKFYIIDDACSHAGGSLAEGPVAGSVVTCPWHGATFDIMTGAVLSDPAYEGVKSYPVKVKDGSVFVEI